MQTTEMDIGNLKQSLQGHGIHYKPGPLPLKGFLVDRLIGRAVSEVGLFSMPTWVRVGPEIGLCYVLQASKANRSGFQIANKAKRTRGLSAKD